MDPLRAIIAFALALCLCSPASGWVLNGYKWNSAGTTIYLQLNGAAVDFKDESKTWNDPAAAALQIWNSYLDGFQFIQSSSTAAVNPGDGSNQVFFSNTIYGDEFPPGVLAATIYFSNDRTTFTETDVIFNSAEQWNSYRGPLQRDAKGRSIFDLRRVALHEFGHVLGLGHPDEHGQYISALMNSMIENLDNVSGDDIAGAQSIYGLRITSSTNPPAGHVGYFFSYQITANQPPSSYGASGLPPGLQLDPNTGYISGTPSAEGDYSVTVSASRGGKTASAIVRMVIQSPAEAPFAITSSTSPPPSEVGQSFAYQITANQQAESYGAESLPIGLQLNSSTGLISGTPTTYGTYWVTVYAYRSSQRASASVQIRIGQRTTGSASVQIFPLATSRLAVDAPRSRIYATVPGSNTVAVIDMTSLMLIQSVPTGPRPEGLAVSADGTKLWVANSGSATDAISVIDLKTLAPLPGISLPRAASDIEEGSGGRLYVSPANDTSGVMQVDAATGTFQGDIAVEQGRAAFLEISPDRKTLYVGTRFGSPAVVQKFDVSAPVAVAGQRRQFQLSDPSAMRLSHDGEWLIYPHPYGNERVNYRPRTLVMRAADLEHAVGGLDADNQISSYPSGAFSTDNAVLYLAGHENFTQSEIRIYDTHTFTMAGAINLRAPSDANGMTVHPSDMVVDPTGAYIFVRVSFFPSGSELRVYKTGRLNGQPATGLPGSKRLANLSTRLEARGGEQSLIGGFIVLGNAEKKVIIRAIGPSLPVPNHLADPTLELRDASGTLLAANDNWGTNRDVVIATGLAPSDEREAAIVRSLPAGSYTAIVGSANGTAGVGLVEMYDVNPAANAGVVNISTRGAVGNQEAVMIGGVIVRGDKPTRVVIRAIGPSLGKAGVSSALDDTTLEVFDSSGNVIAQNDDWRTHQEQELIATTIAPGDDREAAALVTVPPGGYTAVVRGKNDSVGIGLVEIYNLEQD